VCSRAVLYFGINFRGVVDLGTQHSHKVPKVSSILAPAGHFEPLARRYEYAVIPAIKALRGRGSPVLVSILN